MFDEASAKTVMRLTEYSARWFDSIPETRVDAVSILRAMVSQGIVTTQLQISSSNIAEAIMPAQEVCPACEAPVHLKSLRTGVCDAGHSWRMGAFCNYN